MPQQKGFKRASKVLKRQKKSTVRKKAMHIRRVERKQDAAAKEETAK